MLVISSREFRQNQKKYFEIVDQGESVIVQRGKDRAYALMPVGDDDLYFNAQMIHKLKQSILEIKKGDTKKITNSKEISELLGL